MSYNYVLKKRHPPKKKKKKIQTNKTKVGVVNALSVVYVTEPPSPLSIIHLPTLPPLPTLNPDILAHLL